MSIDVFVPFADLDQTAIGDGDTYFKWVAPATLQLYVNGELRQTWDASLTPPVSTGVPIGILAGITYPD